VGLLFVAISLHLDRFVRRKQPVQQAIAGSAGASRLWNFVGPPLCYAAMIIVGVFLFRGDAAYNLMVISDEQVDGGQ